MPRTKESGSDRRARLYELMRERAEKAEAERDVLREALEKIAETGGWRTVWYVDEAEPELGKQPSIVNEAQALARAALERPE